VHKVGNKSGVHIRATSATACSSGTNRVSVCGTAAATVVAGTATASSKSGGNYRATVTTETSRTVTSGAATVLAEATKTSSGLGGAPAPVNNVAVSGKPEVSPAAATSRTVSGSVGSLASAAGSYGDAGR
jgi:hypothetical protein